MSARRTPAMLSTTAVALVFAVALLRGLAPFFEPDVWWHLRVGEHILDTHVLYGRDPWAAFTDKPYLATQWLSEAVAAQVYRWTGLGGVLDGAVPPEDRGDRVDVVPAGGQPVVHQVPRERRQPPGVLRGDDDLAALLVHATHPSPRRIVDRRAWNDGIRG